MTLCLLLPPLFIGNTERPQQCELPHIFIESPDLLGACAFSILELLCITFYYLTCHHGKLIFECLAASV